MSQKWLEQEVYIPKGDFEGTQSDFDLLKQKVILIIAESDFDWAKDAFDLC